MSALIEKPVEVVAQSEVSPPKSGFRLLIEACVLAALVVTSLVLLVRSAAPDDPWNTAKVVMIVPSGDTAPEATP